VGTAVEILRTLQNLGVTVSVVSGERLRFEPADRIPADLIPTLREAKPDLLLALRKRQATCAPSCYEVDRGRWIHHPWDGCTTVPSPKWPDVAQTECKHCDGAGECSCPACNLRRTTEAVPCLMCQPRRRQAWLAATRPESPQCKCGKVLF
jgi:hypothetical protein